MKKVMLLAEVSVSLVARTETFQLLGDGTPKVDSQLMPLASMWPVDLNKTCGRHECHSQTQRFIWQRTSKLGSNWQKERATADVCRANTLNNLCNVLQGGCHHQPCLLVVCSKPQKSRQSLCCKQMHELKFLPKTGWIAGLSLCVGNFNERGSSLPSACFWWKSHHAYIPHWCGVQNSWTLRFTLKWVTLGSCWSWKKKIYCLHRSGARRNRTRFCECD